ncbi:MAG: hypothetical protein RMM06_03615 [Armatimonadota bacterium]|nr:hypothetical protein [bacterium]MCS7309728.1 hypothetical protein [Armatimonadota bacterium]MDW8104258.1 hypothetical protein [Armatimonadota bacterium]MDW8289783.1 hypothetical protein [Armatimonadota bacterium]
MKHAKLLALVAGGVVLGLAFSTLAQQQQEPAIDPSNPAALASSLPVGAAAPAFDVTNVVTGETLCYV